MEKEIRLEKSNMKNILMIGAHFDDTDLAAAGTCCKLSQRGCNVYKLVLTDNVTNFKQRNIKVDFKSSAKANKKICDILGIENIDFECVKCNSLSYSSSLMQKIEKIIFEKNIDTVFIHSDGDFNQDHNEAYRLCLTASRHCDNIFLFESNGYLRAKPFSPNYFVDISEFIETKKKALSEYDAAHNRFGRLFNTAIEKNHIWGYANGCEYAEAFFALKIKD